MSYEADIKTILVEQLSSSITSKTLIPGGLADGFSLPALIKKIEEKLNVTLDSDAVRNVKTFGELVELTEKSVGSMTPAASVYGSPVYPKTYDI